MKVKHVSEKYLAKVTDKIKFSEYVASLLVDNTRETAWRCCELRFNDKSTIHKHVSQFHRDELKMLQDENMEEKVLPRKRNIDVCHGNAVESNYCFEETSCSENFVCKCEGDFTVLLYYFYTNFTGKTRDVEMWQRRLCQELKLSGKIRIANEGINGTVEGCSCSTEKYIEGVLKLDSFKEMSRDDFKTSKGNGSCFDGLKVGVYSELCTLGINSEKLKPAQGNHLSPKEFHEKLEELSKSSHLSTGNETLLLDCRNFYESKIGFFDGALKPDLRKFSYFKEYVDKNQELFRNRKVLSYCTGGIRCERASAYIQQSTNCLEVYQLKGGIHKYLEQFPHSDFYKGKLFVFDNRFGININGKEHTVVSSCIYCPTLCDTYELCTTNGCCQLVLICKSCRDKGVTTCCDNCAENAKQKCVLKHCKCTEIRERAVKEI